MGQPVGETWDPAVPKERLSNGPALDSLSPSSQCVSASEGEFLLCFQTAWAGLEPGSSCFHLSSAEIQACATLPVGEGSFHGIPTRSLLLGVLLLSNPDRCLNLTEPLFAALQSAALQSLVPGRGHGVDVCIPAHRSERDSVPVCLSPCWTAAAAGEQGLRAREGPCDQT